MYDEMLLLRQRMSNGIISLLGSFATGGGNADKKVGGGLLPIALGQSSSSRLKHRDREQAPSHIYFFQLGS